MLETATLRFDSDARIRATLALRKSTTSTTLNLEIFPILNVRQRM
jgi:hypothetical protein